MCATPQDSFDYTLRGISGKALRSLNLKAFCNDTSEIDDFLGFFLLWQSELTNLLPGQQVFRVFKGE